MELRVFERVNSTVKAELYFDNGVYEVTVRNLSRNGLYIDTDICPPCESNIVVVLTLDDNYLLLRGKVKRTVNINELSSIGVELFNPSQNYIKYISKSLNQ